MLRAEAMACEVVRYIASSILSICLTLVALCFSVKLGNLNAWNDRNIFIHRWVARDLGTQWGKQNVTSLVGRVFQHSMVWFGLVWFWWVTCQSLWGFLCQSHPCKRTTMILFNPLLGVGGKRGSYLSQSIYTNAKRNNVTEVRTRILRCLCPAC